MVLLVVSSDLESTGTKDSTTLVGLFLVSGNLGESAGILAAPERPSRSAKDVLACLGELTSGNDLPPI